MAALSAMVSWVSHRRMQRVDEIGGVADTNPILANCILVTGPADRTQLACEMSICVRRPDGVHAM